MVKSLETFVVSWLLYRRQVVLPVLGFRGKLDFSQLPVLYSSRIVLGVSENRKTISADPCKSLGRQGLCFPIFNDPSTPEPRNSIFPVPAQRWANTA